MDTKISIEDMLNDKKFWENFNAENDKIFLYEIEKALRDCRFNKCIIDDKKTAL